METKVFKDLRMTDSMREFLRSIASQSLVAEYLLDTHCFTDYGDFLAIRKKGNVSMISFCPKGKTQEFNENGDYKRDGRQEGSPARVAQKLIGPDRFSNATYELFNNLFSGLMYKNEIEFHVGETLEDFQFAYLEDNYLPTHIGSLWNSCMRYAQCQRYFQFYVAAGARILYGTCEGKVVVRAILWTLQDGVLLLDRIYGCDDAVKYSLLGYAKKELHIRYHKSRDSYDTPTEFVEIMPDGTQVEGELSFTLCMKDPGNFNSDQMPYMDTFKYYADGYIYNNKSHIPDYEMFEMTNADGEWTRKMRCTRCGNWATDDEGDYIEDHGDDWYCRDCITYDEWEGGPILQEDAVSAYNPNGHFVITHINNVVTLANGHFAVSNAAVHDDYNDCYILKEQAVKYLSVIDECKYCLMTDENSVECGAFCYVDGYYYEIATCEGVLIERILREWYLIGSDEWKEAKEKQKAEIELISMRR